MTNPDALRILKDAKAILDQDHFVLTSGRHSDTYVNCKARNIPTKDLSRLCAMLAAAHLSHKIDVVVGPAEGGVLIAEFTSNHLMNMAARTSVPSVTAQKDGHGGFVFTRDDDKSIVGRRILVVEDVLTSGGSVKKVVTLVSDCGGQIVSVGALVNRGEVNAIDVGSPHLYSLVELFIPSWTEEECQASQMCHRGVPINTTIGHGAKYLASR